ncbi:restriction endonuclease subunit S [Zhaonella formicivorans]|uniref:restriction endonuclease subunit S n=1 Tax=Zhaonella formicivorans TaxID=2528593 RepID=UPI0010E65B27|nr:restriction endonuclease subunit S [Zhaonella formicivorans]
MLKPYAKYKSIPELWITQIPDNWSYRKIKYLFNERCEKGYPQEPLLVASQNMGVVPKDVYGNRTVEAQKDLHLLKLVKVGDFVISLRSFQGGIEYSYYQGIISPAYTVMAPKEEINSGYFRHLAKSRMFIELLQMCVTGIREGQNIDYTKLKNHLIPIPPRKEQDQIVRFLDWKLAKINKLIRVKKKQIELLNEQKQVIINNAVTKGLDKNSYTKDSGIKWIGNIPEGWNIRRLKTVGEAIIGLTYSPADLTDENDGMLVFRSSNIKNGKIVFGDNVYVNCKIPEKLITRIGDILICSRNGSRELVGKCALIDEKSKGYSFGAFTTVFRTQYPEFIYYVLNSYILKNIMGLFSTSTINQLTTSILNNIRIPFPPYDEQRKIVSFLDEECSKIDIMVSKIEREILLFQEYRARLISDVVTGKVDVRGIEIPEYEAVPDDVTEDEFDGENAMDDEAEEAEVE